MRSRMLAVGLTAIVAGAVVGATPAYAADGADLAVEVAGTTIAEGVPSKFGTTTITNNGPGAATGVLIEYDATLLDTSKVALVSESCPLTDGTAICEVTSPAEFENGQKASFGELFEVQPGATGDAGSITVHISADQDDPDSSNNSVTVPVSIGESGPDLFVFAPDVHNEAAFTVDPFAVEHLDSPVMAGSETVVEVYVENQGSVAVQGIELSITLPEHVTFTLEEPGDCTHAVGDSTTTCTYEAPLFTPVSSFGPDESCLDAAACGWFVFPVAVSEDAPTGPLTDGVAEGLGIDVVEDPPEITTFAAAELPRTFTTESGPPEIDPTDNVSGFTVFVSDEPGGSGGGDLPVTGVPAALLGVGGAAVLALGVGLFLFTRKRRVVLQTPADGSAE